MRVAFDSKEINEQYERLFDYAEMLRKQIGIIERQPASDVQQETINKRTALLSRIDKLMDAIGLRGVEEYLDKVEKSLKRPRDEDEKDEDDKMEADGDEGFFEGGSGKHLPIVNIFKGIEADEQADIEQELLKKQKQPPPSQSGFVFVPESDWEVQMRQNQQEQPFNPPPGDAGPMPLFTAPLEPLRTPKITRRRTLGGKVKPGYYTNWKPDPPRSSEKKRVPQDWNLGFGGAPTGFDGVTDHTDVTGRPLILKK